MKKYLITISLLALLILTGCDDALKHPFNQTVPVHDILAHPSSLQGIFYCHGLVTSSTNILGYRCYTLQDDADNSSTIRVSTYREVTPQPGEELIIRCKLTESFAFGDSKILTLTELRE